MFEPDYRNILDSAKNIEARRLPLYEHIVSYDKIAEIENVDLMSLYEGDESQGYNPSGMVANTIQIFKKQNLQ